MKWSAETLEDMIVLTVEIAKDTFIKINLDKNPTFEWQIGENSEIIVHANEEYVDITDLMIGAIEGLCNQPSTTCRDCELTSSPSCCACILF